MSWNLSDEESRKNSAEGRKRSRVTRACDICRRKKIKCDINNNQQCSACIQYGWECTFNNVAKKRGPPKGYIESLENRLKSLESLLKTVGSNETTDASDQSTADNNRKAINQKMINSISGANSQKSTTDNLSNKSKEDHQIVSYLGSSSGYYLVEDVLSAGKEKARTEGTHQMSSLLNPVDDNSEPTVQYRKVNIEDGDVMFVRSKTSYERELVEKQGEPMPNIVPKHLLDLLINRYNQMDESTLPVLDKQSFLDAYHGRTQPSPPPILIYSVCAHTCALLKKDDPIFVDTDTDRDDIYTTLTNFTSNLSRTEYFIPKISTIQSLVLLCGFLNTSEAFYKNWLRSGMAVRMAQELGLHRSLERFSLSEKEFESRKRLWYCVYVLDRWVCSIMGRPLAIAEADCDIELPHVNGGVNGTEDYSIFNHFIKLSGILGEILRRVHSPRAKAQGYNHPSVFHTVQGIDRMLTGWLQQLPDHHRLSPEEAEVIYQKKADANKVRQAGPLMTCYYALVILLYRTFLVAEKQDVYPKLYEEANKRCAEAARYAIEIARLLKQEDIIGFGWSFTSFSIYQAALIHVYNSTSSSPELAVISKEYVKISIEECIKPMSTGNGIMPSHFLPILQTIINLVGNNRNDKDSKTKKSAQSNSKPETAKNPDTLPHHPISHSNVNILNYNTTHLENYSQQSHLTSIDSDIIDIERSLLINSGYSSGLPKNSASNLDLSNRGQPNKVYHLGHESSQTEALSTATWENLFSSAAAPFFETNSDWQNVLISLFSDSKPN